MQSQEHDGTTFNPLYRSTLSATKHFVTDRETDNSIMPILVQQYDRPKTAVILYLKDEFDGKDSGENEVEVVEDDVTRGAFVNRVLGSQGDAAGADNDHDKQIEVSQVDDKVTESTNSAYKRKRRYT